jgi:hypothetical protein
LPGAGSALISSLVRWLRSRGLALEGAGVATSIEEPNNRLSQLAFQDVWRERFQLHYPIALLIPLAADVVSGGLRRIGLLDELVPGDLLDG